MVISSVLLPAFLDSNGYRVSYVRQASEFRDDIPRNVDRFIKVEPTVVVSANNEFYRRFFCPTKAFHQRCIGISKEGAASDFFGYLSHFLVDKGPFLDLGP